MKDNNNTHKADGKGSERAERISTLVYTLMDERVPADIRNRLVEWFDSAEGEDEKLDALEKYMRDMLRPRKGAPSEYAVLQFGRLMEKLGLATPQTAVPKLPTAVRKLRRNIVWRVAAVLIPVAIAVGVYVWSDRGLGGPEVPEIAYSELTTARELTEKVMLPDGSMVVVSRGGKLEIANDFNVTRRVRITGEAFFAVARQQAATFTVEAGNMKVRVLGTEFRVRAFETDATSEVSLSRGKVSVSVGDKEETFMEPGQHLVYDRQTGAVTLDRVDPVELDLMRGAGLRFYNSTGEEILTGIGNYFGVTVKIRNNIDLGGQIVFDLPEGGSLDDAMFALRSATGRFDYEIVRDTVIISDRK